MGLRVRVSRVLRVEGLRLFAFPCSGLLGSGQRVKGFKVLGFGVKVFGCQCLGFKLAGRARFQLLRHQLGMALENKLNGWRTQSPKPQTLNTKP